jgi:hypothetical protein
MQPWAGLIFAAATLSSAATQCREMYAVTVYAPVEAVIARASLAAALDEARWILRSLCADVEWVNGESNEALVIRILPEPVTTDQPPYALGLAMPNIGRGNRGAVFLGRIRERVKAYGGLISLPTLLGCAMAHEIGHLLLRTNTHASEGIMRPEFGKPEIVRAAQRRLTFTAADRTRVVSRLAATTREAPRVVSTP